MIIVAQYVVPTKSCTQYVVPSTVVRWYPTGYVGALVSAFYVILKE